MTRRAGVIADRRSALKSLAASAFVTGIAASLPAEARKRSKKKTKKNKALKRCKAQVAPCQAVLETLCDPGDLGLDECLEDAATCCAFLDGCNAQSAMECIIGEFIV